tara:strand:+ start:2273 stop:2437 length:165 start_codon:yes stop_codon:yes gene_type:complete
VKYTKLINIAFTINKDRRNQASKDIVKGIKYTTTALKIEKDITFNGLKEVITIA